MSLMCTDAVDTSKLAVSMYVVVYIIHHFLINVLVFLAEHRMRFVRFVKFSIEPDIPLSHQHVDFFEYTTLCNSLGVDIPDLNEVIFFSGRD